MMVTSFRHPDRTPMSAQQFLEMLFGRLPEFFRDEDELRALWSNPDTRAKLLHALAEKGFGPDQMSGVCDIKMTPAVVRQLEPIPNSPQRFRCGGSSAER